MLILIGMFPGLLNHLLFEILNEYCSNNFYIKIPGFNHLYGLKLIFLKGKECVAP